MSRKDQNQPHKPAAEKTQLPAPVEDLIRRALNTKRPASGWPWEKHQGKSGKK